MQYEYGYVSMDLVMENPEEFIIPECMDACKTLWDKGIETFMCSNYENTILYVSINELSLSDENKRLVQNLLNDNNDFFVRDIMNHTPTIVASTPEKLVEVAALFKFQDAMDFENHGQILDRYKRQGSSELEIRDDGSIIYGYNKERLNATIDSALKACNLALYDAEEGKLFGSKYAYEHHKKYKEVMSKLPH